MSHVFLATETASDRQVVFKLFPPELSATVNASRFRREVRLAARLHHPHLVPLLTGGEIDGAFLYYTMPYVEGESLRELLRRETRLAVRQALGIAREVADALSYAHEQRVIHRDIKPENILLPGGHAMLTDFGIARALDEGAEARVTRSGYTLGTPAYMSPEQVAGEPVDGRADIYSLGCVLYEMLAGQPPFSGASLLGVLTQRLAESPQPLSTVRTDVPRPVEKALERALAWRPRDRFQTAAEFAGALGRRS
jgi:serine/threonine-protein kinase